MQTEEEFLKVRQSFREPRHGRLGVRYYYEVVECHVRPDRTMPDIGRVGPLVTSLQTMSSWDLDELREEGIRIEIESVEGTPESNREKERMKSAPW